MKVIAASQLISDAKLFSNQRSSAFLTDDEWLRLINLSNTELFDLMIQVRGHEPFEKVANLSTTANSAIVALPADWYQTLTLLANWGNQQLEELQSLDHLGDQVGFRNWNEWQQFSPKAWRMRGQLIELFPTPKTVTPLELRYIFACPELATPASTMDDVNGWGELVSSLTAIKALTLQALPTAGVEAIYGRVRERVEQLAADRAAANAPSIRDIYSHDNWPNWRRLPWPVSG